MLSKKKLIMMELVEVQQQPVNALKIASQINIMILDQTVIKF